MFHATKKAMVYAAAAAVLCSGTAFAHHYEKGDLFIQHPWSRATPKSAEVGGGYMKIKNNGASDDALLTVTSPVADRIEIHEMSMDNNVMKMREIKGPLNIPAHKEVDFSPNGLHIMFIKIKTPFVRGESFPATLHFQKAGDVDVKFAIDSMDATTSSDHRHGEH